MSSHSLHYTKWNKIKRGIATAQKLIFFFFLFLSHLLCRIAWINVSRCCSKNCDADNKKTEALTDRFPVLKCPSMCKSYCLSICPSHIPINKFMRSRDKNSLLISIQTVLNGCTHDSFLSPSSRCCENYADASWGCCVTPLHTQLDRWLTILSQICKRGKIALLKVRCLPKYSVSS